MNHINKRSAQGLRRTVFLLTAIVMIFSMILPEAFRAGTIGANAADNVGDLMVSNFKLWVNGEELGAEGVEQPTVKDGDKIELAIDWKINNNEDYFVYQAEIGSIVGIDFKHTTGALFSGGQYVGDYAFDTDENGVTIFSVKLTEEAKKKSDISGGVLLEGTVSIDKDNDIVNGSTKQIGAGGKTFDVTYDDNTGHGSMTLKKTNGGISRGDDGDYYVNYEITATVKGMINTFTLDDVMPEGIEIVGDITVDGGVPDKASFPMTITTDNAKKKDTSTVKVSYRARMTADAYTSNLNNTLRNTASVDYKDDLGEPQNLEASSSVKPAKPTISKSAKTYRSSSNQNGEELTWVKGMWSSDNNPGILGGAYTDTNKLYYAIEWTIIIEPGTNSKLTDEEFEAAIRSITDQMMDNTGAPLTKRDWVPYHSNFVDISSNDDDILSYLLHKYDGSLADITNDEYRKLTANNSTNISRSSNGRITITYKTVIVKESLRTYQSDSDRVKVINNTVDISVLDEPVRAATGVQVDIGIDILDKDVELDLDDIDEVYKRPKGSYSPDWEASGTSNALKPGKDLSDVPVMGHEDGIYEVPYRVVIKYDQLARLYEQLPDGAVITISDRLDYHVPTETNPRIPTNGHQYFDEDDFWFGFKVWHGTNGFYIYQQSNGFEGMKLTSPIEIDGKTVYTGWELTFKKDSNFVTSAIINGKNDLVFTYYSKVKMIDNGDGTYSLDPEIVDNGGYKFMNTVDLTVTVGGVNRSFTKYFSMNYGQPEPEVEYGNINKSSAASSLSYRDIGTLKLTDPTKNQLGWYISIPTKGLKAGDKLVIKDTLPEGLSFIAPNGDPAISHGIYYYSGTGIIRYEECKFEDYSITAKEYGFDINVSVTQEMLAQAQKLKAASIRIYYVTSYDPEFVARHTPEKSVTFTNTATVYINDDDREPVTADVDVSVPKIAGKNVLSDKDSIFDPLTQIISADYSLDINIDGYDLDPDSDTLTVVDTMSDCMTLDEASVTFTDAAGNSVADCTFVTEGKKIIFTVPDGRYVIISYSVTVDADPIGDPFWGDKAVNSFDIEKVGVDQDYTSKDLSAFNGLIRAWAYNTTGSITVHKYYVSPEGKVSLKGAKFVLRRVYDNNRKVYAPDDKVGEVYITDDDGEVTIDDLPLDMIYKLEEIEPPEGGFMDEHENFYFILKGRFGVTDPRNLTYPTDDEKALAAELTAALGNRNIAPYEDGGAIQYVNAKEKIIKVVKHWVDYDYSDEYRPDTIEISLRRRIKDGEWESVKIPSITWEKVDSKTWQGTISGLRAYDASGNEYTYEVSEKRAGNYLDPEYEGDSNENITNTLETIDLVVTKKWSGDDDHKGEYRKSVKVKVYADGAELCTLTLDESNGWSDGINNLPKYTKTGNKIVYTVKELEVPGYKSEIESKKTETKNEFIIKNSFETVDLTVKKNWLGDEEFKNDYRPDNIKVNVYADKTKIGTLTLNGDNDWSGGIKDLPKYTTAGTEIVYTVEELSVSGYKTETQSGGKNSFIINNTFETVDLTIKKLWSGDEGFEDEYRPDSITVQVLANGRELEGVTLTLEGNDWSGTVYDLPKYDTDGKVIVYTVKELAVAGYTPSIEGSDNSYVIKNSFDTVDLTVTKFWNNDEGYADEYRPDAIEIQVIANGNVLEGVMLTLDANGWAGIVKNLPKYDTDGNEIIYTVREEDVAGYTASVTETEEHSFRINNSFETVDLSVKKEWQGDEKYAELCRPEKIEVQILANGKVLDGTVLTLTGDDWSGSVSGLPKYDKDGSKIVYTVKETVKGYTASVQNNGEYAFIIRNSLETVSVSGIKTWLGDSSFADVIRPEKITIVLKANGNRLETAECTAATGWTFTFGDLPKYSADGKEIKYTVSEENVTEGYTSEVQLISESGNKIVYAVLNTFTEDVTEISVVKTWVDNGNADKTRPESITVKLLADGVPAAEVVLTAADNATGDDEWTYTFKDLPVYSSYKIENGRIVGDREIVYTAVEVDADNYDKTESGLTIINTLHNEDISVSGVKVWKDFGNKYKTRPEMIKIILSDNIHGTLDCEPVWDTETDPDNWTYTFSGLPKYEYVNGERITLEYSVTEEPVSGYTTEINGMTITNTLDTTTVTSNKLDKESGEEVIGAKLELYDEYGDKLGEWSSASGAAWDITALVPGRKYTIKEVEAPEGYLTAEDTVFTVDKDGNITIVSGKDASISEDGMLIISDTAVKTDVADDDDSKVPNTGAVAYPITALGALLVLTTAARKRTRTGK